MAKPVKTAKPAAATSPAPNASSYFVAPGLYLVMHPIGSGAPAVPVERETHHVCVIDCSGSMSYDLPQLRQQLKSRLASLVGEHDVVSLIWFSGRNECGVLAEGERVNGVTDLSDLHKRIDRWLRPVGMTGFAEPFAMVADVVERVKATHPGHATSLLFLTDGQHNTGPRSEVMAAVQRAAGVVDAAACVAYSYYADQAMLTEIAERLGGSMVLARDFSSYAPIFEGAMQRRPTGSKRVAINVGDTVGGFVFALSAGDLLTYAVTGGVATVPADLAEVAYLSPVAVGMAGGETLEVIARDAARVKDLLKVAKPTAYADVFQAAYAALALYGQRVQPKVTKPLLRALGDVALANAGAAAFGKQKVGEFVDMARAAAFGVGRFASGYDPAALPKPGAFTVLDLLTMLAQDPACRFFPDHEAFVYKRITRERVDASDRFAASDVAKIQAAADAFKVDPSGENATRVEAAIEAAKAALPVAIKFIANTAPADGYSMAALVPNSESPNMSIRVKRDGVAVLPAALASQHGVPQCLPTHTYSTYAVIADGILNVERLPVRLSAKMWAICQREGFALGPYDSEAVYVLDLTRLPILNEIMVVNLMAGALLERAYRLEEVRAALKVYQATLDEIAPARAADGLAQNYGADAAAWLESVGVRDYGFSPAHTKQAAPSGDVRTVRSLKVAFAGYSTEPSVAKVRDIMTGKAKGKMPAWGVLMEPAVREVDAALEKLAKAGAPEGTRAHGMAKEAVEAWLMGKIETLDVERRGLLFELAKAAFIAIVAPAWFSEWPTLGDIDAKEAERGIVAKGEMTVRVGGADVKGTITLQEKSVAV